MKTCKFLLTGMLLLILSQLAIAQKEYKSYFEVGKPCPDYTFNNVANYSKKEIKIGDFKGKWLILDFWYAGCSGCIASFPKTNEEQKLYKDNIQFLLIADDLPYKHKENELVFEKLNKRLKLKLPCVFDTDYPNRITEANGYPFIVVVDPDGIVRSSGRSLDGINLAGLTKNSRPKLPDFFREHFKQFTYDAGHPFLVNNNGGNDSVFLFRSILTHWSSTEPAYLPQDTTEVQSGKFAMLDIDIPTLYMAAEDYKMVSYQSRRVNGISAEYGKIWCKPIVEVKDSATFHELIGPRRNKYSYSLQMPSEKASKTTVKRMMLRDLQNYFGYTVTWETRKMPYWRLTATVQAKRKLKTKGDTSTDNHTVTEEVLVNQPMDLLLYFIDYELGNTKGDCPLLDETGIQTNIDIDLKWAKADFGLVQKALKTNGLELVKGEKEMQVLVIRDKGKN